MAYPAYRPTPARAAALKRAQAASAAKRRGKGKGKLAAANRTNARYRKGLKYTAIGVGSAVAVAAAVHGAKKGAKAYKGHASNKVRSAARTRISANDYVIDNIRAHRSVRRMAARHGPNSIAGRAIGHSSHKAAVARSHIRQTVRDRKNNIHRTTGKRRK